MIHLTSKTIQKEGAHLMTATHRLPKLPASILLITDDMNDDAYLRWMQMTVDAK